MKSAPVARIVKTTSLYTLIVKPDQTFEIKIDGDQVKEGSLLEDFIPAVNPDKEIDDPKDEKPADWVDEAKIPDPKAVKPEDWDEDAPYEITDEEATKPDDWLEDEPLSIPDPEAEKPEDWDDEEDGDWIPPTVPNPKCDDISGCGKWEQPTKKNPEYKGKWSPDFIDNPAYKGVWSPRKIPNPDYYEDKTPANFEPIGAVGRSFIDRRVTANRKTRLGSRSGLCKTTSFSTTSTSVIQSRTQRSSKPRPLILNTQLSWLKMKLQNLNLLTPQSHHRT